MFREMRRKQQALDAPECEAVLDRGATGVLAVLGDDGYPYAVPLNYVRVGGKLYFHCAKSGAQARRHSPRAEGVLLRD